MRSSLYLPNGIGQGQLTVAMCMARKREPAGAQATCLSRAVTMLPQEKHARLAAALALSELTQERDIQGVVAKWGREGFVSRGKCRVCRTQG